MKVVIKQNVFSPQPISFIIPCIYLFDCPLLHLFMFTLMSDELWTYFEMGWSSLPQKFESTFW